MFSAPRQGLRRAPPLQTVRHPVALREDVQVDQVGDALFARQLPRASLVAHAQQVVDQQAVEADLRPALVLDVDQAGHAVQRLQVLDAGGRLTRQLRLVPLQLLEPPLQATQARYLGVERGRGLLGSAIGGEGGVGGNFDGGENGGLVAFKSALEGFEVLAGELVGKAEKGLLLSKGSEAGQAEQSYDLQAEGGTRDGA